MEWVQDHFASASTKISMPTKDQVSGIANQGGLKILFQNSFLPDFWIKVNKEHPETATHAILTLLPFLTSYFCDKDICSMAVTKTKLRNYLDVTNTLHLSLSATTIHWNRHIT